MEVLNDNDKPRVVQPKRPASITYGWRYIAVRTLREIAVLTPFLAAFEGHMRLELRPISFSRNHIAPDGCEGYIAAWSSA
jgi:hypothetical protein